METKPVAKQSHIAEVLPPEAMPTVLEAIKPMLNEKGELAFNADDFSARLQAFQSFQEKLNCNLVLFENSILSRFPKGASLLPLTLFPKSSDSFGLDKITNKPADSEKVEPSAEFFQKIGMMLGVQLRKTFEGVVQESGVKMYSIRYSAYMTLPDGTFLSIEDEGKDQALYTKDGGIQAHIVESTRKKAKRNAIKALLSIPTTMSAAEFNRPWLLLRPIFRPESDEAKEILVTQKQIKDEAHIALLGRASAVINDETVDFETLMRAIDDCKSLVDLDIVGKRIAMAKPTNDQRAQLSACYRARKSLIETGEVIN